MNNKDKDLIASGYIDFDINEDGTLEEIGGESHFTGTLDESDTDLYAKDDVVGTGNFWGTGGSPTSQVKIRIYWSQRSGGPGVNSSTVVADLYWYTQYGWYGNALTSNTYLTINNNKKSLPSNVNIGAASGERKVMSHSVSVSHSGATSITIAGSVCINGSYGSSYISSVTGSSSISLKAPEPSPIKPGIRVRVGGTYRTPKNTYVKVGGTYRAAKGVWVKVGGTYRAAK